MGRSAPARAEARKFDIDYHTLRRRAFFRLTALSHRNFTLYFMESFTRVANATDQVSDNDKPGGDPYPRLQLRLGRDVEPGHRLDQPQPAAHRALRVVLVGPRIA